MSAEGRRLNHSTRWVAPRSRRHRVGESAHDDEATEAEAVAATREAARRGDNVSAADDDHGIADLEPLEPAFSLSEGNGLSAREARRSGPVPPARQASRCGTETRRARYGTDARDR